MGRYHVAHILLTSFECVHLISSLPLSSLPLSFLSRHEKVQENCIDLVGRIADRGAEFVPAKEWMRICFELLELLKAHKKAIRRATVNTFGYIAKAIGLAERERGGREGGRKRRREGGRGREGDVERL